MKFVTHTVHSVSVRAVANFLHTIFFLKARINNQAGRIERTEVLGCLLSPRIESGKITYNMIQKGCCRVNIRLTDF